jgi:hypothetical protein
MAIYVDFLTEYPASMIHGQAKRYGTQWCHLWCDPEEEDLLHAFAAGIGLKRAWFQHEGKRWPHYDLLPRRRALAIAAGAIEISFREWLRATRTKDTS